MAKKTAKAKKETIKKTEFISTIAAKTGITKVDTQRIIDATIEEITEQMKKGNDVTFTGFGSFKVTSVAAKKGRNPRTGEEVEIPAHNRVRFTAGKTLRDAI